MATQPPVNKPFSPAEEEGSPPSEAAALIAEEIGLRGPMTFRDFMERALYQPGCGYYAGPRAPWTDTADYVTAPQVHSAVGAAVARLAEEGDAILGTPEVFDVVEFGGGDGTLMSDLCAAVRHRAPGLYERLRIWCVERGGASRHLQQTRLSSHGSRVRILEDVAELPAAGLRGLVFSNELLDAMPVHRVVQRGSEVRELYVDVEAGRLVETEGPPSTDALQEYLRFNDIELEEGQRAEICLAAADWLAAVASRMSAGLILTIDYGAATPALYGEGRMEGSLVCQRRYQLNSDPYRNVGEQDITAHVDLGNLRRRGSELGLEWVGEASLAVFLVGFGAADGASLPDASPADAAALRDHLGLRHLLFTEIGDAHRVVLQVKDLDRPIRFGTARLG